MTDEVKEQTRLLVVSGRLDAITAPGLEETILEKEEGVKNLILDLSGVEYISSAGLQVLLDAHKRMEAKGGGTLIRGVTEAVRDISALTEFSEILTVE